MTPRVPHSHPNLRHMQEHLCLGFKVKLELAWHGSSALWEGAELKVPAAWTLPRLYLARANLCGWVWPWKPGNAHGALRGLSYCSCSCGRVGMYMHALMCVGDQVKPREAVGLLGPHVSMEVHQRLGHNKAGAPRPPLFDCQCGK